MLHAARSRSFDCLRAVRHFIAIRREPQGFGIRFGLTEAEDELRKGPVFRTLPEALAWIDEIDRLREIGR